MKMLSRVVSFAFALFLSACGGGGGDSTPPPVSGGGPVPISPPVAPGLASSRNPIAGNCSVANGGSVFANAEAEPSVAINPRDANNLIGAWQQDRWSNGGANGVVSAYSTDGGTSWQISSVPFSRCTGGNAANGGDYERATDPWLSFSPSGTAYQMALGFNGSTFSAGSASAMLVSRSTDGGRTWSNPTTLKLDGAQFFNDKNALIADPVTSTNAYAVWDRLSPNGSGPTWFARTIDNGVTWEPAKQIYNPGSTSQTIGNLIAVLPSGMLINFFTQLDPIAGNNTRATLNIIRSADAGVTWSAPIRIAEILSIGARDPETGTAIRDASIIPSIATGPSGEMVVVWQDARFSNGARDAIAISRSVDAGLTWSTPARVNTDASVIAFIPTVHVRADGLIGVSYFDFRSNTPDATTLPTDYWLARSRDGVTWSESRIGSVFDFAQAPNTPRGYFIGDYMALTSNAAQFIAFYVRATGDAANRTDVFATPITVAANALDSKRYVAEATAEISPELRAKAGAHMTALMAARMPGWKHPYPLRAARR